MNDDERSPKEPEIIADNDGVRFHFHPADEEHRAHTIIEMMMALGGVEMKYAAYELDWVYYDPDDGFTFDFINPLPDMLL